MSKPARILTLHVSIDDIVPAVWRRIEVDADITLRTLHHILQASFGWTSSHLHEFRIEDDTYTMLDNEQLDMIEELDRVPLDDSKAKLGRLVYPGQRFNYLYDFGDSWTHTIHVENITAHAEKLVGLSLMAAAPALRKTSAALLVIWRSSTPSSARPAAKRRETCSTGPVVSSMRRRSTSARQTPLCYGWPGTAGERNNLPV
jgi:hypothetical protein